MIIGLCGEKESGKDTVAAYLVKNYEFERKAFADPLKQSVAALFNIPFSEIDPIKGDPDIRVVIEHRRNPAYHLAGMTFRQFLQRYGTESHRGVFGQDFWLDYTLPVGGYYPGRNIVLTDVRFENEANRIKQLGGFVVRIYRSQVLTGDTHVSENFDFGVDHIIYNNSSLEQLWPKVEDMLLFVGEHAI